jgi:hypothetical protein
MPGLGSRTTRTGLTIPSLRASGRSAALLVWLVMVVARNQLGNEDAPHNEPNCDAQDYEYGHWHGTRREMKKRGARC